MRTSKLPVVVIAFALVIVSSLAAQCPPDQMIVNGASLGNGVAVGLNTSGNLTNWLTNNGTEFIMQYPSSQAWGVVFYSFGAAGPVGSRQFRDLSACSNLVLEISGDPGSVDIGIQDWRQAPDGLEPKVTVQVSSQWQTISIPLSKFAPTDLKHVYIPAEVVFGGSQARTVRVRSIKYTGSSGAGQSGVLAHIAAGGGQWSTVITLVNPSSSQATVNVVLRGDDGAVLSTVPLTSTQQGATQTVTGGSVNAVLNPNASLLIAVGDPTVQAVVGWAEVLSSVPVNGFAIFRSSLGSPSEGTVPLQTGGPSAIILPYDNSAGFVTGVALANLSASSATITATIWDDNGNLLGSQPISVAGAGHTSFVVSNQLTATAGKRGIVQFQSIGGGGLSGLGLRFSPFGTFTSVPTIPQ